MAVETGKYDAKIRRVLQKFLEPDFKIRNDVYLQSLLVNIVKNAETQPDMKMYTSWIDQAIEVWKSNNKKPSNDIASFTVNLLSFLVKDEKIFWRFLTSNSIEDIIKILQLDQQNIAPTLKLGYIKLLHSTLDHESGMQWTITSNYWRDALNFTLTNQTMYIIQEGHKFIAKLLYNGASKNEVFTISLIEQIMTPLKDNASFISKRDPFVEINDEFVYKNIGPTLNLIGGIFENIAENKYLSDFKLVHLFVNNFELEQCITNYLAIAHGPEFTFDLCRISFILSFFELCALTVLTVEAIKNYVQKICNVLMINMKKGYLENVLKFCYLGNKYHVNTIKIKHNKENNIFENQMMLIQMLPVVMSHVKLTGRTYDQLADEDELRGLFADKTFKLFCKTTMRTVYTWKEYLVNCPNIYSYSCLALNYLLKCKKYYDKDIGTTAFQSLIYCLKDIVAFLKDNPDQINTLLNEVNFLSTLMECLAVFIMEYELTWTDSVETTCVMNLTFDFLTVPTWPCKLVVKALKLVDISISKYMAPNLALLIDRTNDSTMAFIGPLLYSKLHAPSWEVRDSALEVVCTISHFANTKFPSFKKLILDSDLTTLVIQMAFNDAEGFVRMSAIKCLQQMIVVSEFWLDSNEIENLHENLLRSMLNETEGIVRKEVANLISKIYQNQLFLGSFIDRIYDVMAHLANNDLHWEVKVQALNFWEQVIKLHLDNQGMIDGTFPKVTFSKENRKIVNLNETEIKKRLIKVLHQLSASGCLSVLIVAIKDDCDLTVSKNALRIAQPFLELLKKYEITEETPTLDAPSSPMPINFTPFTENSTQAVPDSTTLQTTLNGSPSFYTPTYDCQSNESILEDILNSQDIQLLTGVYNKDDKPIKNEINVHSRQIVAPKAFLMFAEQDLQSIIDERNKWLTSIDDFDSLLNDILKNYTEGEVNSMDCY